ncbi:MAG: cytochrome c oxidase assembly protein [Steroidobacteraceae bacterium]
MHSTFFYLAPWEPSPTVILVCAASAAFYTRGLRELVRRGERSGFWRPFSFFLGLALNYAVLQTYCDYLAQHMFWIHRLQHLVLHHVAPVLIILASPGRAIWAGIPLGWRGAGERLCRERRGLKWLPGVGAWLFRAIQHPVIAPVAFVGLIYFWLTPSVHFGAMLDLHRYLAMNWSMAIDGLLFWWLMLAPRRLQGSAALGYPSRILIVCLVALPQILLGAYITLHPTVLFDVYGICGRAWAVSPLTDQQLGGLLTWIPAAMMSGVAMLVILRRLLLEESEAQLERQAGSLARGTAALVRRGVAGPPAGIGPAGSAAAAGASSMR